MEASFGWNIRSIIRKQILKDPEHQDKLPRFYSVVNGRIITKV